MDKVYAVWDYYDGPRTGVADYRGHPHYFSCQWDAAEDDFSRTYALSPIEPDAFALVKEQWSIWCRWELDFHAGRLSRDSHPGLGGQNHRYDELQLLLQQFVDGVPVPQILASATFHPSDTDNLPAGVMLPLFVEWT